jgi:hypothetical protein
VAAWLEESMKHTDISAKKHFILYRNRDRDRDIQGGSLKQASK